MHPGGKGEGRVAGTSASVRPTSSGDQYGWSQSEQAGPSASWKWTDLPKWNSSALGQKIDFKVYVVIGNDSYNLNTLCIGWNFLKKCWAGNNLALQNTMVSPLGQRPHPQFVPFPSLYLPPPALIPGCDYFRKTWVANISLGNLNRCIQVLWIKNPKFVFSKGFTKVFFK